MPLPDGYSVIEYSGPENRQYLIVGIAMEHFNRECFGRFEYNGFVFDSGPLEPVPNRFIGRFCSVRRYNLAVPKKYKESPKPKDECILSGSLDLLIEYIREESNTNLDQTFTNVWSEISSRNERGHVFSQQLTEKLFNLAGVNPYPKTDEGNDGKLHDKT